MSKKKIDKTDLLFKLDTQTKQLGIFADFVNVMNIASRPISVDDTFGTLHKASVSIDGSEADKLDIVKQTDLTFIVRYRSKGAKVKNFIKVDTKQVDDSYPIDIYPNSEEWSTVLGKKDIKYQYIFYRLLFAGVEILRMTNNLGCWGDDGRAIPSYKNDIAERGVKADRALKKVEILEEVAINARIAEAMPSLKKIGDYLSAKRFKHETPKKTNELGAGNTPKAETYKLYCSQLVESDQMDEDGEAYLEYCKGADFLKKLNLEQIEVLKNTLECVFHGSDFVTEAPKNSNPNPNKNK